MPTDTFYECYHVNDLVPTNTWFGPAARMPYLLCGHWRDTALYKHMAIGLSIYVNVTFAISFVLYFLQKYKRNMKQTYTNTLILLFNFSNALIFTVLVNVGWISSTFTIAAIHNAIEALLLLVLYKKFFKKLVGGTEERYDLLMNIGVVVGIISVLPHLVIVDFQINTNLKFLGGLSDIFLFLASLAGVVKHLIDVYRQTYKQQAIIKAERRHVVLLLNTFSHTLTVVLSFATCMNRNVQFIVIVLGTFTMNTIGAWYFVLQIKDKMYSRKFRLMERRRTMSLKTELPRYIAPATRITTTLGVSATTTTATTTTTTSSATTATDQEQQKQSLAQPVGSASSTSSTPRSGNSSPSSAEPEAGAELPPSTKTKVKKRVQLDIPTESTEHNNNNDNDDNDGNDNDNDNDEDNDPSYATSPSNSDLDLLTPMSSVLSTFEPEYEPDFPDTPITPAMRRDQLFETLRRRAQQQQQ